MIRTTSNLKSAAFFLAIVLIALALWRRNPNNQPSVNPAPAPNSVNPQQNTAVIPQTPQGTQYRCRMDWFYKESPGAAPKTRIIVEPNITGAKLVEPNGQFFQGSDYGCYISIKAGKCVAFKLDSPQFRAITNEWEKCDTNSADVNGRQFQDSSTGEWYYFFGSDYLFVLQ